MKTEHKGYTIVTEATKSPGGGWSLVLEILAPSGAPLVSGLNLGREMTFATEELAHRTGLLLARYWIDGRAPR